MERRMLMRPKIIAMKGHPCTGKSTLARSVAEDLKCPLFAHDDVRDSIAFLQESLETKCLDEQSHEAICQIALTHLRLRMDVIIDSSLCRQTYLDQLLQISASAGATVGSLVGTNHQTGKILRTTIAVQPQIMRLENVSKITVDTTRYVKVGDLVFAIQRLSNSPGIHCIDYHDWVDKLAEGLIEDWGVAERKDGPKKLEIVRGGQEGGRPHLVHCHILRFSEGKDDDNYEKNCRGCLEPIISGRRYKCDNCEATLHQSCVELPNKKETRPQDYPLFSKKVLRPVEIQERTSATAAMFVTFTVILLVAFCHTPQSRNITDTLSPSVFCLRTVIAMSFIVMLVRQTETRSIGSILVQSVGVFGCHLRCMTFK
ncbi:hypothetical protein Acr_21g0005470 [Actinidia rufa]|uniref:DC1 domain-containing protein n=1 Tax=Actinidia rufa TaxID=165716 RepID=A0A7J0GGV2_9ERIC|nr:hypothetical protein Acr_21g0005470 [Actinidia rufa]